MFEMVGGLIGEILGIVNKTVPNEADRQKITQQLIELQSKTITAQSNVVMSEANGQSWLQRNWRPLLMCEFGFIIFNNYILAPFMHLVFHSYPILSLPPQMWDLLTIGVSGYIIGRSGEKIAGNFKK